MVHIAKITECKCLDSGCMHCKRSKKQGIILTMLSKNHICKKYKNKTMEKSIYIYGK
uniref:Uncharacterized protein n=1 Tax=Anguilla anguilla TaxID=7936 RepID=A0A0E9UH84_ANGAN